MLLMPDEYDWPIVILALLTDFDGMSIIRYVVRQRMLMIQKEVTESAACFCIWF